MWSYWDWFRRRVFRRVGAEFVKKSFLHDSIFDFYIGRWRNNVLDRAFEIHRRSVPPPPAIFLAPTAFLETAQDREERLRQQKLHDEARKKREDKYEKYLDGFAKDYSKGVAAHYAFLQESIVVPLLLLRLRCARCSRALISAGSCSGALPSGACWLLCR